MSAKSGKATAPRSPARAPTIRVVPDTALHRLIRDYQDRRARLEARQTDHYASGLFRQTLQLQARTLTMVISDLEALAAGKPGRLDCG